MRRQPAPKQDRPARIVRLMPHKGFFTVIGVIGLALSLHCLGGWFHSRPLDLVFLKCAMPRWNIPPGMDRYDMKIRHVFAEAFGPEVEFREVLTGGMLEIATFIRGDEWIELRTNASASVWDHEYLELLLDGEIKGWDAEGRPQPTEEMVRRFKIRFPLNMATYPVTRRAKPITPDLKARLVAIVQDALQHARPGQYDIGVDGRTSTYFLRTSDGRVLAGSIWSPEKGPARALGTVCHLTSALIFFGGESPERYAAELEQAISAYWEAARVRTHESVELDHHPADLGLHPPQAYEAP